MIEEYTEVIEVKVTYVDEKTGKEYIKIEEQEICTVDINKTMSATDCSSYFAFINHNPNYQVKDGKKKEIIHKEVLDFYNDISKTIIKVTKEPVKETEDAPRENGTVEIYNEILSPEEIASYYFKNHKDSEMLMDMYLISYDLYKEFLSGLENEDVMLHDTGLAVPHYFQSDYKHVPYGDGTISSKGCAPTSIAMVLSYLTGKDILPPTITNFTKNKYYVDGVGSSWSIFPACAKKWGVNVSNLGNDINAAIEAVQGGSPVIVSVKKGKFTSGGHLMVIRGVTEDGYLLINDPNRSNYDKFGTDKFTIKDIVKNGKNYWSFYN